jgi:hypothetical protein
MLLMEKICAATKLVVGNGSNKDNLLLYFIPFKREIHKVSTMLGDVKICKFAMMTVLRIGRTAWSTCMEAVESGLTPQHGLKGK